MTLPVLVLVVVLLALPLSFAVRALRVGRRGGAADRAGLVAGLLTSLLCVVAAHRLLPWEHLPPLLWALPVAGTAAGLGGAALGWWQLPGLAGQGRARLLHIAGVILEVVVSGGLLGLALWG